MDDFPRWVAGEPIRAELSQKMAQAMDYTQINPYRVKGDLMTESAGVPLSVLEGMADDAQVHESIAKSIMSEMLARIDTPTLRTEINRRTAREHPQPRKLEPCAGCGAMLGARERRLPCPKCGGRNPRTPRGIHD